MHQYLDLVNRILTTGRKRADRTGTGTIGIFGHQMRFNLAEGFPLVTTKKTHLKSIIHELLWFLQGDTNNETLEALGVKIWREWALEDDAVETLPMTIDDVVEQYSRLHNCSIDSVRSTLRFELDSATKAVTASGGTKTLGQVYAEMHSLPTTKKVTLGTKGALGPIYGHQWRSWTGADGQVVDQITKIIDDLRIRPYSRRHIVSAWNVADLPDETKSPQENVLDGRMALAPCHALFQFYVEDLTPDEVWMQVSEYNRKGIIATGAVHGFWPQDTSIDEYPASNIERCWNSDNNTMLIDELVADYNLKTKRLSCQLYQRSTDVFIGQPFNIASYALLTMMIAQQVDMLPGEFVWTGGDTHLYLNHIGQSYDLLEREPRALPTMTIVRKPESIFDYSIEDFRLDGYDPYPAIKAPISI